MPGPPQVIYPLVFRFVADEEMVGIADGANVTFTTQHEFIEGTICVYLNGNKLRGGASKDFVEVGDDAIEMDEAPLPGDVIVATYYRKN